jgi:hypothetical protein
MKTRIFVGAALLLTLGSALGGSMIHSNKSVTVPAFESGAVAVEARELTPEMIAKWKATSATAHYSPPMLPI